MLGGRPKAAVCVTVGVPGVKVAVAVGVRVLVNVRVRVGVAVLVGRCVRVFAGLIVGKGGRGNAYVCVGGRAVSEREMGCERQRSGCRQGERRT